VAVAVIASTVGLAGAADADESVVRTAGGAVRGTVAIDHRTFQGIPYAAPPVGALRWRSPQPATRWQGLRDATRPAEPCPQMGGKFGGRTTSAGR